MVAIATFRYGALPGVGILETVYQVHLFRRHFNAQLTDATGNVVEWTDVVRVQHVPAQIRVHYSQ